MFLCFVFLALAQSTANVTSANHTSATACSFSRVAGLQYVSCYSKTFALLLPSQCLSSQQCGIVIDVHGLSMGSDIQDLNTNMRALGEKYNYAILQPQASGNPPWTSWSSSDDKDVYEVIIEVVDLFELDELKIHMTGFSQGGGMTWRFLYTYGGILASVAPIAMNGVSATESPPTRRPVLFTAGTTDGLVSWSSMLQTQKNLVQHWSLIDPQIVKKGDKFIWTRWRSDIDNTVLEFVQHDYETVRPWRGHCFPGSQDIPPKDLLPGQVNHNGCPQGGEVSGFVYGDIIMNFFVAHPLQIGSSE